MFDERGGGWLRIVLDAPPGNLLTLEMIRQLTAVLEVPGGTRKWITVEGAGDHFSFGAAIQEHVPGPMERVLPDTHALFRRMLGLPCPTAALVHGRCLGGGFELALACDVIIATGDAALGFPEIALAAFPPAGAVLLPLRVGTSRAAAAALKGSTMSGSDWFAAGLVDTVVGAGGLHHEAARWFDRYIAPRSAVALAAAAQACRLTLRAAAEPALAAAERLYLERVLPSADAAEGVRAFLERRAPGWKDQ